MSANLIWFRGVEREDVALVGGRNSSLGEYDLDAGGQGHPGADGLCHPPRTPIAPSSPRTIWARSFGRSRRGMGGGADDAGRDRHGRLRQGLRTRALARGGRSDIRAAYRALGDRLGQAAPSVAVRLVRDGRKGPARRPCFAGQEERHVSERGGRGRADRGLAGAAIASLFTDGRSATAALQGFGPSDVALSAAGRLMVRSDISSSGVMFSIDTETGCDRFVLITGAWGLGENVVQGRSRP